MDFKLAEGETASPNSVLWFAVPAITVIIAVGFSLMFATEDSKASTLSGTSYDASNSGYRALYSILDELGFSIERTRKVAGGSIRWALAPLKPKAADLDHLREWVGNGGKLLLADPSGDLAAALGIQVRIEDYSHTEPVPTSLSEVAQLALGKVHITPISESTRTWNRVNDEPIASIHQLGEGEIWLLHWPQVLTNEQMRRGDNPIFAARLAEAMSAGGRGKIGVDEYCHGLRARPGVLELLLQPPIRTSTIQATIFVGLLLWGAAVRIGPIRPLPSPRRRSKEEFLNAVADLLHRQGDTGSAFRTIQDQVIGNLAERLGMPEGSHPEAVVEVGRRRQKIKPQLADLLIRAAPPAGRSAFVSAIHSLDEANNELTRR